MLFNYYSRKAFFLGLAIALGSCNNTEPDRVAVIQPTPSQTPDVVVVPTSTPLFENPPIAPIVQNPPRPRLKKTPAVTNPDEIPVIIEGGATPLNSPIVVPLEKPASQTADLSLKNEIKDSLSQELGLSINSLNCPKLSLLNKGETANCQVVTNDGNFGVKVVKKGQQFEYEPQGAILISDLESNIEAAIRNRQGRNVKASCAGEVLIFQKGDFLNCQVTDAGKDRTASINFKNLTGNSQSLNVKILGGSGSIGVRSNQQPKNDRLTPQKQPTAIAASRNSQKLESSLKGLLAKDIGTNIRSISCPDRVEKNFNKVYTCQAVSSKGKFSLNVRLTNSDGRFKYQTKGVLLASKLGQVIGQEVENSTGKKVDVDCGESAIIFKAGETIGCQISTGKGEPQNIKVTIQDDEGKKVKVNYNLAG